MSAAAAGQSLRPRYVATSPSYSPWGEETDVEIDGYDPEKPDLSDQPAQMDTDAPAESCVVALADAANALSSALAASSESSDAKGTAAGTAAQDMKSDTKSAANHLAEMTALQQQLQYKWLLAMEEKAFQQQVQHWRQYQMQSQQHQQQHNGNICGR
jgi:hypothetical protein